MGYRTVVMGRLCLVALSFLAVSGCSMFMPDEITAMQKRTGAAAQIISSEHPDWFHTYTVDGRTMHYVKVNDAKAKPLVIFVHGSPGDWSGWTDYLTDETLTRKAHLIAVDRPGFGGSGKGITERSLAQQSKNLAPLLAQASKGRRVILVGHSYGGPLVARIAMDYPDKVTDIIILAGSIDPAQEETKWYQYPADWRIFRWAIPEELVATNQEIMALKPELEAMLPLWPRIHQRVTVIQGEKDDLVPAANADFAEKMLVNAKPLRIIRLPENNHFLPWNQTELVKATIIKHLE